MDNFNSEPTNQFPNQENQDMNFTQNNLSPQEPAIDTPENDMSLENNGNNLNSAQEQKNSSNENTEENDENKKKKGTRRSKREAEGRNYVCKMCSKSYLSYPALYTHYKQKHNTNARKKVRFMIHLFCTRYNISVSCASFLIIKTFEPPPGSSLHDPVSDQMGWSVFQDYKDRSSYRLVFLHLYLPLWNRR